jgi:predicted CopG family antitoxin|tara:strand:+ start:113 stop:337 length:225 start_codon:yes stop_codon:yes gene_type:complete
METTIQISKELLGKLQAMKLHSKESYENLIWDLIEDRMEFSGETKKNIAKSEKEIKEGKTHKWEDVKKELGINV